MAKTEKLIHKNLYLINKKHIEMQSEGAWSKRVENNYINVTVVSWGTTPILNKVDDFDK